MLQPINLESADEEPIELTHEEIRKFEEAFKNPEFRDLFRSYMEDISSPETRRKYEAQITELERERGNSIRWVRPTGHFSFRTRLLHMHRKPQCLMTTAFQGHDTDIVIVNVASSPEIAPPVSKSATSKGAKGTIWSLPHSLTPPRPGILNENEDTVCTIIDVIYHPDVFEQSDMETTLISTAIESISTKLSIHLSTSFSKLDTQKYVGTPINTVIREQTSSSTSKLPPRQTVAASSLVAKQPKPVMGALEEPRHSITHQHKVNMQDFAMGMGNAGAPHLPRPDALVVRFELPKVSSVEAIDVDVQGQSVILTVPGIYHCVLSLPFSVDSNDCAAKWIASKSILELHCPVVSSF